MSSSMSADQRKALVRHYIETFWNTPETDEKSEAPQHAAVGENEKLQMPSCAKALDTPVCPTCVYMGVNPLYMSLAEARKIIRTTFPDLQVSITDLVVEGEKVVVRWLMQGTDLGGYQGYPPTGRSMRMTGITMMRMEDQTIVEEWIEVDIAGMLRQLGFVFVPQPPKITVRRQ